MSSRGAINGDVLNAFFINGGQVTHEAAASGTMAVGSTLRLSQIHSAPGALSAAITGSALARRRSPLRSASTLSLGGTALARARIGMSSASVLVLDGVLASTRRAQFAATSRITFTGAGLLFWHYRQRASRERVLMVPLDQRARLFTTRGP